MGDRPGNPELLDYLATRFVENGWSIKKLHREIMLSAAYELSADHQRREHAPPIRKTGCSGAQTASGWMRSRCAIRCCLSQANST